MSSPRFFHVSRDGNELERAVILDLLQDDFSENQLRESNGSLSDTRGDGSHYKVRVKTVIGHEKKRYTTDEKIACIIHGWGTHYIQYLTKALHELLAEVTQELNASNKVPSAKVLSLKFKDRPLSRSENFSLIETERCRNILMMRIRCLYALDNVLTEAKNKHLKSLEEMQSETSEESAQIVSTENDTSSNKQSRII